MLENIDYLKHITVCFRNDSKFKQFIVEAVDWPKENLVLHRKYLWKNKKIM